MPVAAEIKPSAEDYAFSRLISYATRITTPIGKGTINGESTRTSTLLYRVTGVDGAVGNEAWFESQFVSH